MASPDTPTASPRRRDRLADDRVAGAGMVAAAVGALVWANWPHSSYFTVWNTRHHLLGLTLRDWVDQALLVAFFAVVGLELRREVIAGELRTVRRAAIPVVAALVGMALPAALFTIVIAGGPGAGAWGVPTATDVAFAVAALAVVGNVSARARIFLLTLAVADDLAAIVLLVAVYSRHVSPGWLAASAVSLAALVAWWWCRLPAGPVRVGLASAAWWSMLHAGVEASVVGAALGAWGPRRRPVEGAPAPQVRRWLARLQPSVNVIVLPIFAVANVGVVVGGDLLSSPAAARIFVAVVAARVLGKPLGIVAGTALGRRLTGQPDQPRVARRTLVGTGAVAGIGFTVPLLIVSAALPVGPEATAATAGLLVASVLSMGAGAASFRLRLPHRRHRRRPDG